MTNTDIGCVTPQKMIIDLYAFQFIAQIQLRLEDNEQPMEFVPHLRYRNVKNLSLYKYGAGPFCKVIKPTTLTSRGIYLITVDKRIRYVGECINLSKRFGSGQYANISPRNCFKPKGQTTNCKVNHLILNEKKGGHLIELWFNETPNLDKYDRKNFEETIISIVDPKPDWND